MEKQQLKQAIETLKAQRAILSDTVVETSLEALYQQLEDLERSQHPSIRQRKQVTILFAELYGFTKIAETMDHEEVHEIMDDLWHKLDKVILAHGGRIDQHMGDSVMALFGTTFSREDDPERAVQTALALQEEVNNYRVSDFTFINERQSIDPHFQIQIGIHTGFVSLGSIGVTNELVAMGSAVDIAKLLEKKAPVGGILLSHDLYLHIRGIFKIEDYEKTKLEEKEDPTLIYQVKGYKTQSFPILTRSIEGIETPTVGRDSELGILKQAFLASQRQEQRVITLMGEPGIGKSRLLYEFENWVELRPEECRFFQARGSREKSRLHYFLVRELFESRFGIQENEGLPEIRKKFEEGITGFMGAEALEKAHFIGHLIGIDFSNSPFLQGILEDSKQIHKRALHYSYQFFSAVLDDNCPNILIFLEDIHWADQGSIEWFEFILKESPHLSILMVSTARPTLFDLYSSWGENIDGHTLLPLELLNPEDCQSLVEAILCQIPQIPPLLLTSILTEVQGSPLYTEEFIKLLIEDGVILKGEEEWKVQTEKLNSHPLVSSLNLVVQNRVRHLSPPERKVLERASVVGRIFWGGAVEYLGKEIKQFKFGVEEILNSLQEKELVFCQEKSIFSQEKEYQFKHSVFQEVVYKSLSSNIREHLHCDTAIWLIKQTQERSGEYSSLIAENYEKGKEKEKAALWYLKAGKKAQEIDLLPQALSFYKKALELFPSGKTQVEEKIKCYKGLGDLYWKQDSFMEAQDAYHTMLKLAEEFENKLEQAYAWNKISKIYNRQGEYTISFETASKAEVIAKTLGEKEEHIKALFGKARSHFRLGKMESSYSLIEQSLKLSKENGNEKRTALSLNLLGMIYDALGDSKKAIEHFQSSLELFRKLGDRAQAYNILNNIGENARLSGDYQTALAFFEEALTTSHEIGSQKRLSIIYSNIGGAKNALGDYDAAEKDLLQALELLKKQENYYILSETYLFLAETYLGKKHTDQALQTNLKALELIEKQNSLEDLGKVWLTFGKIASKLSPSSVTIKKESYNPHQCFNKSLRIFKKAGMESFQARVLRTWAQYELEHGNYSRGKSLWQKAKRVFVELGMVFEILRMQKIPEPQD